MKSLKVAVVALVVLCGSQAFAEDIFTFARRLDRSGGLFHDRTHRGIEVVYRSSSTATESMARSAWRRSPSHARLLPRVTQVICVGRVCVGR